MRRKCTSLYNIVNSCVDRATSARGNNHSNDRKHVLAVNLTFKAKNGRRGWPLLKTDESRLRYYNIAPTFILEVKLRTSVTRNVPLCCALHFFSLRLHELRFTFSVSRTCSHARTLLLSRLTLARLSFYSVSEEQSNGPPLAESSLSGFSSFLRTSMLASRDQTPFVVGSETQPRCIRQSENPSDVSNDRLTFRRIVRSWKILCNFTRQQ